MAVEAVDAERLLAEQKEVIERFFGFGVEVPPTPDRLFEVFRTIEEKQLFQAEIYYLTGHQLSADLHYPGLKIPLSDWFIEQIRKERIAKAADSLPRQWTIVDVSRRPNYKDYKKDYEQVHFNGTGLPIILADLRGQGQVGNSFLGREASKYSRFWLSADNIDGKGGFVAKAVASILGLQPGEQVTTLPYAVFNYIGNLAHPEFGQVRSSEWFADGFKYNDRKLRMLGGDSIFGGLSSVSDSEPPDLQVGAGFHLMISFPYKKQF